MSAERTMTVSAEQTMTLSAEQTATQIGETADDTSIHQFITHTHDEPTQQRRIDVDLQVHVPPEGRGQRRTEAIGLAPLRRNSAGDDGDVAGPAPGGELGQPLQCPRDAVSAGVHGDALDEAN